MLVLIVLVGCGSDSSESPAATSTPGVVRPAVATPSMQPGYVASPLPLPGRQAPDSTAESLAFTKVRVLADSTSGVFVIHANVTNSGGTFLNNVALTWQIVGAAGKALDQGETTIGTLAPGETTSLVLTGSAAHDDGWVSVRFELAD